MLAQYTAAGKWKKSKKNWKESHCTIKIFTKKKFEIMCHMIGGWDGLC